MCGPLERVANGDSVLCGPPGRRVLVFSCRRGFRLQGPQQLACSGQGRDDQPPVCKGQSPTGVLQWLCSKPALSDALKMSLVLGRRSGHRRPHLCGREVTVRSCRPVPGGTPFPDEASRWAHQGASFSRLETEVFPQEEPRAGAHQRQRRLTAHTPRGRWPYGAAAAWLSPFITRLVTPAAHPPGEVSTREASVVQT